MADKKYPLLHTRASIYNMMLILLPGQSIVLYVTFTKLIKHILIPTAHLMYLCRIVDESGSGSKNQLVNNNNQLCIWKMCEPIIYLVTVRYANKYIQ